MFYQRGMIAFIKSTSKRDRINLTTLHTSENGKVFIKDVGRYLLVLIIIRADIAT